LSLGLFLLAVGLSFAAVGGVDVAGVAVMVGLPALAIATAVGVVRLCGLDELVGRLLFTSHPPPSGTIQSVVSCAQQAHSTGVLSLAEVLPRQTDRLLADGLRLVLAGADVRLIRSALEHKLDRSIARHARWLHALAVTARFGPVVGVPMICAAALALLERGGDPTEWSLALVAGVVLATLLLPAIVMAGPARDEVWRRVAARALAGTIVIEGVAAICAREHPRSIEGRLLGLLPPQNPAQATPAAA
jgi:chemotaxis protein MotA